MLMMIRTITPQMDLVLFKTTSCFALLRYWPQDIQFFVNAIPSRRSWTSCQGLVVSRQYTLGKPSEASTGGWARKDVSGVSIYIYTYAVYSDGSFGQNYSLSVQDYFLNCIWQKTHFFLHISRFSMGSLVLGPRHGLKGQVQVSRASQWLELPGVINCNDAQCFVQ